jgi:multidrug efflux pump subunit AcrB
VRFDQGTRDSLDAIRQLRLPGADGTVTLGSVADVSIGSGYAQIYRLDRYRNVAISVELSGRAIGDVMAEARQLPALLGVVVKRTPDADAYGRAEPELLDQLLEVRRRLVEADLGEGIGTAQWPAECRAPS